MAWRRTANKPLSRSIMVRIFASLGLHVLRESHKLYSDQTRTRNQLAEKPLTMTCALESPKWVITGITDASTNVAWFGNLILLIHWGRATHLCVTIIDSDNGLSPDRCQAIIWTNAGILVFGPLGTNFSGMLIEIYRVSFKKMHLKISSGKWRPFCLGLNVLNGVYST